MQTKPPPAAAVDSPVCPEIPIPGAWREVRHDIRSRLNIISLHCALLRQQHRDSGTVESLAAIIRSIEEINHRITELGEVRGVPTSTDRPISHE